MMQYPDRKQLWGTGLTLPVTPGYVHGCGEVEAGLSNTWNITPMVKGREKRKRMHPLACSLVLSLALHSSSSPGLCQVPLMVDEATSINVIKTVPTDVSTGQPSINTPSLRLSSEGSLGCIKFSDVVVTAVKQNAECLKYEKNVTAAYGVPSWQMLLRRMYAP